ncbi:hypothetical protein [Aureimonas altamirensis]|uniref:hypothetical protein n=1 Tax=Aureimonas altamirensis TaxID=370622 RepID=UPI003016F9AC
MSKSRFKRKGKSKFLMIEGYIMRSPAWRALTPNDKAAYLELKWRYDGMNNGRIGLGERELSAALGIGRETVRRSLLNLIDKGFLAKAKASGFNVKSRAATEWRLTEYACDLSGHFPTKDFMRWGDEKSTGSPQVHTGSPQALSNSEIAENVPDRLTSGPVSGNSEQSQAHLRSTYSITTGGRVDAA